MAFIEPELLRAWRGTPPPSQGGGPPTHFLVRLGNTLVVNGNGNLRIRIVRGRTEEVPFSVYLELCEGNVHEVYPVIPSNTSIVNVILHAIKLAVELDLVMLPIKFSNEARRVLVADDVSHKSVRVEAADGSKHILIATLTTHSDGRRKWYGTSVGHHSLPDSSHFPSVALLNELHYLHEIGVWP